MITKEQIKVNQRIKYKSARGTILSFDLLQNAIDVQWDDWTDVGRHSTSYIYDECEIYVPDDMS